MTRFINTINNFINEESGQTAIEYIMIVAAAVIVTVVFFFIYQRMTKSGAEKIELGVGALANTTNESIMAAIPS